MLVVLAWAEAAVEGAENPGVERGSVAFGRWGSAGKRTEDVGDWVETGVVALSGSDSYSSSVSSNSTSAVSATKLLKRLKSDDAEGFSMVFVLGGFCGIHRPKPPTKNLSMMKPGHRYRYTVFFSTCRNYRYHGMMCMYTGTPHTHYQLPWYRLPICFSDKVFCHTLKSILSVSLHNI